MQLLKLLFALTVLLAAGLVPVLSQDGEKKEGEGNSLDDWKKANEPNENHKLLQKMAGEWDSEVTFTFDPTKEPEVNKTVTKKEMMLGGRFLLATYEIKTGAMPHTGQDYLGYNNRAKKFQVMHLSTVDTAMEVEDGDYDAKARTITFKSAMKEMEWGGQKIKYSTRMVYTFESDDKHTFSIFTNYPEMKGMEDKEIEEVKIVYTRKK